MIEREYRDLDEDLVDVDYTQWFDFAVEEEKELTEEELEKEQLQNIEEETKKRQIEDEDDDGYDKEIDIIKKEENETLSDRELLLKKTQEEKELLLRQEREEHQETSNNYIQQWLSLKGFINPQGFIQDRNLWNSFNDFLHTDKMNKKSLEVLFFSNSLSKFLWENYLDYYQIEDIVNIYKNIAKNKDFLSLVFSTKVNKKILQSYKKYYVWAYKFKKVKQTKKKKDNLFGLDIDLSWMLDDDTNSIVLWLIKLYQTIKNQSHPIINFIRENTKILNDNDFLKEEFINCFSLKAQANKLLYQNFLKNLALKKYPDNEKYEVKEEAQPIEELFSDENIQAYKDELKEVYTSTQTDIRPKKLTYAERNYNIQKYLDTIGFMDNKIWYHLKEEFWIKNVSRVKELNKYISWNKNLKLEVFNNIIDRLDYHTLNKQVEFCDKIEVYRLLAKKSLIKLSTDNLVNVLVLILANKPEHDKLILSFWEHLKDVIEVARFCDINFENTSKTLIRFNHTLNILRENMGKTKEEKKLITIDDTKANDKWVYEKIPIIFDSKVKSILIDLFVKIINERLYEENKSEIFQKFFTIRSFGYITGKTMFEKNRVLLYLREKWEYGVAVYWMASNLFNKLKGLGVLTMHVNWRWEEKIDSVHYKTLWEKTLQDFENTLIETKEINAFKNFKKKLVKFSNYIDWDAYTLFQNTFKNIDWKDTFLFFRYEEIDKETYFFFSDGEISVRMKKQEYRKMIQTSENNWNYEDKDFVNTARILKQEVKPHPQFWRPMLKTKIDWVDEDWKYQKSEVFTNMVCNVRWENDVKIKDYFENNVHKGLLSYYFLYYHSLFNKETKRIEINWKQYKWLVIYDLETIGFTGNIILSYFLYVWYETVILQRYSHKEFWDFFDKVSDWDYMYIWNEKVDNKIDSLEAQTKKWLSWEQLISWHNILSFDNKKIAEDITQDRNLQNTIKEKLDWISIDVLAVLMQAWYWRIGLDFLSKINFDFGKNIKKSANENLMDTILKIQSIIKMPEWELKERTIKNPKNAMMIHKFIAYNKNDVLMSLWLLGQLLKYWKIATWKRLARLTPEQLTFNIKK